MSSGTRRTLVPYGGEGASRCVGRVVTHLTDIMMAPGSETVLAVSHGSATLQFKLAWERTARCPQDVHLGNCCILAFEFNRQTREFANTAIVNQHLSGWDRLFLAQVGDRPARQACPKNSEEK